MYGIRSNVWYKIQWYCKMQWSAIEFQDATLNELISTKSPGGHAVFRRVTRQSHSRRSMVTVFNKILEASPHLCLFLPVHRHEFRTNKFGRQKKWNAPTWYMLKDPRIWKYVCRAKYMSQSTFLWTNYVDAGCLSRKPRVLAPHQEDLEEFT